MAFGPGVAFGAGVALGLSVLSVSGFDGFVLAGAGVVSGFSGLGLAVGSLGAGVAFTFVFPAFLVGAGVVAFSLSEATGVGFALDRLPKPKKRCQKLGFGVGSGSAEGAGFALVAGAGVVLELGFELAAGLAVEAGADLAGAAALGSGVALWAEGAETFGSDETTGSGGGVAGVRGGGGTSCWASRVAAVRTPQSGMNGRSFCISEFERTGARPVFWQGSASGARPEAHLPPL